jgi:diguanylate cyclase (GGDEF)-like protein
MLSHASAHHDLWLVALAALICIVTSFTTFALYAHMVARAGARRLSWLLLAGFCAGAGTWATHFVAMLAYQTDLAIGYDPWLTIASFVAAVIIMTGGLSVSMRPGRMMIAAGGATIGLGVAAMHFLGMQALVVAGGLQWNIVLIVIAVLLGTIMTAGAMLAFHEQSERRALVSGATLLAGGICSLHFTAMAALTILPALSPDGHTPHIDGTMLAVAVASMTALVLFAGYLVALVDGRSLRESFARMSELMDAAIEGLVITDNDIIVNMNSRALALCGRRDNELIGKAIFGSFLEARRGGRQGATIRFTTSLLKADGTLVPVEVIRRQLHSLARGNEVYAIRDLREREEAARQLAATNQDLQEKEQELRTRNLILHDALSNMSQGLCMYDQSQRVVISNERFATIYGLPGDAIQPGMTLKEVVQKRIDNGVYAGGSPQAYMDERTATVLKAQNITHELNNGQIIAIARRPLRGGWLTTHEDVTAQSRMEAQITRLAHHDALTDLPSRRSLRGRLADSLSAAGRHDCRFAVIMLGIDRFAEINKMQGHEVGDRLLQLFAKRLQQNSRQRTILGRFSDDKFVVAEIVEHPSRDAATLVSRIQEEMCKPFALDDMSLEITVSAGIALFPADAVDADTLLKNAALALRQARTEGRGSHRFFEAAMDRALRAKLVMEQDLSKALEKREFELHYQPLVDLTCNEITGFEAFLRWKHPTRGMLFPGEFLPLAEEVGLINAIDEWALQEACKQAMQWPRTLALAVNFSESRFRSPNLMNSIGKSLASTGLAPDRLQIEVTEKVLHGNGQEALKILRKLSDLGVRVVLDDFGAGFSSLSYLRQFPFHKVKIDRSFIAGLSEHGDSRVIIRTLARLGTGLRMATAAEGVETKEQLDIVRAEGCTEMQGHYFSPPKPAEEISRLLLMRATSKTEALV